MHARSKSKESASVHLSPFPAALQVWCLSVSPSGLNEGFHARTISYAGPANGDRPAWPRLWWCHTRWIVYGGRRRDDWRRDDWRLGEGCLWPSGRGTRRQDELAQSRLNSVDLRPRIHILPRPSTRNGWPWFVFRIGLKNLRPGLLIGLAAGMGEVRCAEFLGCATATKQKNTQKIDQR
jgi:hypothetical protein